MASDDPNPAPPALPASAPRGWRADLVALYFCGVLLACAVVGPALGAVADRLAPGSKAARVVAGELSLQLPVLVGAHLFLRRHGTGWVAGFGLRRRPRAWALGAGVGTASFVAGLGLQYVATAVLERLGRPAPLQDAVLVIAQAGPLGRAGIGLFAIAGAAVAEEVLFRGILFAAVRDAGLPRAALWGTALFFGAIHMNLAAFVPLTLFGAALAWLYARTGTLGSGIAAHAAFNLLGFLAAAFSDPPPAP